MSESPVDEENSFYKRYERSTTIPIGNNDDELSIGFSEVCLLLLLFYFPELMNSKLRPVLLKTTNKNTI